MCEDKSPFKSPLSRILYYLTARASRLRRRCGKQVNQLYNPRLGLPCRRQRTDPGRARVNSMWWCVVWVLCCLVSCKNKVSFVNGINQTNHSTMWYNWGHVLLRLTLRQCECGARGIYPESFLVEPYPSARPLTQTGRSAVRVSSQSIVRRLRARVPQYKQTEIDTFGRRTEPCPRSAQQRAAQAIPHHLARQPRQLCSACR